jgi:hypothetical protein
MVSILYPVLPSTQMNQRPQTTCYSKSLNKAFLIDAFVVLKRAQQINSKLKLITVNSGSREFVLPGKGAGACYDRKSGNYCWIKLMIIRRERRLVMNSVTLSYAARPKHKGKEEEVLLKFKKLLNLFQSLN